MNIYRFIDSRDIRAHLEKINYDFSTQEAAYMVWHCRTASLTEKESAWNEIIKTMPNCSLEERLNMMEIPDFHEFLRTYMKLQKKMMKMFRETDRSIYFYEIGDYESNAFSDFNKCMEASIKEMPYQECDRAKIRKCPIDNYKNGNCRDSLCVVNAKGEVTEIKHTE